MSEFEEKLKKMAEELNNLAGSGVGKIKEVFKKYGWVIGIVAILGVLFYFKGKDNGK